MSPQLYVCGYNFLYDLMVNILLTYTAKVWTWAPGLDTVFEWIEIPSIVNFCCVKNVNWILIIECDSGQNSELRKNSIF